VESLLQGLDVQFTQEPLLPQALSAAPGWQVFVPGSQQPPLQAV
jgi:hypothetical protein